MGVWCSWSVFYSKEPARRLDSYDPACSLVHAGNSLLIRLGNDRISYRCVLAVYDWELHTAYKGIELNEVLQSLSPSQALGFVNNASYNEITVRDKFCGPLATAKKWRASRCTVGWRPDRCSFSRSFCVVCLALAFVFIQCSRLAGSINCRVWVAISGRGS